MGVVRIAWKHLCYSHQGRKRGASLARRIPTQDQQPLPT